MGCAWVSKGLPEVPFVTGYASEDPDAGGVDDGEEDGFSAANNDTGRAMRTTPMREIQPAICCVRVKGSWRTNEHTQQARIGARKVRTVASAKGR